MAAIGKGEAVFDPVLPALIDQAFTGGILILDQAQIAADAGQGKFPVNAIDDVVRAAWQPCYNVVPDAVAVDFQSTRRQRR